MFQYTTETIINSNKGNLVDGKRAVILHDNGTAVSAVAAPVAKNDILMIDGVGSFKVTFIKAIYKTKYDEPKNEKVTLTITTAPAKGDVLRLAVALREEGRASSLIQNAYLRKQKPFFYEIISTGKIDDDAAALVALIEKEMSMTDFDYFKVSSDAGAITFEAKDPYIRFVSVELDKVLPFDANAQTGQALLGFQNYVNLEKGVQTQPGKLGQGTVEHLIKDLRIPTNASINPFAADHGGLPIPGGEYDQYLIEYVTPRHHVSASVMGSVGDQSMTSHILFVEKTKAADVETVLDAIDPAKIAALTVSPKGNKVETGSVQ